MISQQWTRGGLYVGLQQDNGLLTIDFGGLVTATALVGFAKWVADFQPCDEPVVALLARFHRATVCATAEALTAPLRDMPHLVRKLQVPGAVLCRPHDLPTFRAHERLCEELGIVRRPFDDDAKAWPWCQQKVQAALRARQAGRRLLSRPASA